MGLADFNIDINWGKSGLNKEGWKSLFIMLDGRFNGLEEKATEAKSICEATRNELKTYQLVRNEADKAGCVSCRHVRWIAVGAFLIGVVHATYSLCVHIGHWAKS